MPGCEALQPYLSRVAESEASPDEALEVARHLSDCTACRIVLAREQRLARMLEEDLEDLAVGDGFVDSVMAELPDTPPARVVRRERRRGLKLAMFAGLIGATTTLLARQFGTLGGGSGLPRLRFELESLEGALQGLLALTRLILVVLDRLSSWLPVPVSSMPGGLELALGLTFALLFGLAATSTLLAVAAGSVVRLSR
jgi:anti-sigma factor RsiW